MLLLKHTYHPVQNICRWFYCKYDDSATTCYTKYVPAMDGTSCGSGKVSNEPCMSVSVSVETWTCRYIAYSNPYIFSFCVDTSLLYVDVPSWPVCEK